MALVTAILLLFSIGVYFFSKLYLEKRFFKRLQDRAITTTTLLFDLQATDSTVTRLVNISDKELLSDENISVYNEKTRKLIFTTNSSNQSLSHLQLMPLIQGNSQTTYTHLGAHQILGI
jgi:hypothetical protein